MSDRRSVLSTAMLVALTILSTAACHQNEADVPPNVVLYVVDTLRADAIGPGMTGESSSPAIDRLALRGVSFDQAYAQASWTRSSMASLLTGRLPWNHGAETRRDVLDSPVAGLAPVLSSHGYDTALITANPNVSEIFGFGEGFDHVTELFARRDFGEVRGKELIARSDVVSDEALDWLAHAKAPFFLVVLAIDPHAPYRPAADLLPSPASTPRVSGENGFINRKNLTAEEKQEIRALYQAEVRANDNAFGTLIDGLDQRGDLDHTIVVVTSDHGEEFWENGSRGHGKSLSHEVLHVPLIIKPPLAAKVDVGNRVQRRVELIDIAPTILTLAGAGAGSGLDGRNLFASTGWSNRPTVAALRIDDQDLRSASDGRWKVVWDRQIGSARLFDLQRPLAEGHARPKPWSDEEEAAAAKLTAALDARGGLSDAIDAPPAKPVPEEIRRSLEALGYATD